MEVLLLLPSNKRLNDLQAHLVNYGSARAGCAEGWRLAGVGVHQEERRTLLRLLSGPQKMGEYLLRQKKKRRGAVEIKRIDQGIQVSPRGVKHSLG